MHPSPGVLCMYMYASPWVPIYVQFSPSNMYMPPVCPPFTFPRTSGGGGGGGGEEIFKEPSLAWGNFRQYFWWGVVMLVMGGSDVGDGG